MAARKWEALVATEAQHLATVLAPARSFLMTAQAALTWRLRAGGMGVLAAVHIMCLLVALAPARPLALVASWALVALVADMVFRFVPVTGDVVGSRFADDEVSKKAGLRTFAEICSSIARLRVFGRHVHDNYRELRASAPGTTCLVMGLLLIALAQVFNNISFWLVLYITLMSLCGWFYAETIPHVREKAYKIFYVVYFYAEKILHVGNVATRVASDVIVLAHDDDEEDADASTAASNPVPARTTTRRAAAAAAAAAATTTTTTPSSQGTSAGPVPAVSASVAPSEQPRVSSAAAAAPVADKAPKVTAVSEPVERREPVKVALPPRINSGMEAPPDIDDFVDDENGPDYPPMDDDTDTRRTRGWSILQEDTLSTPETERKRGWSILHDDDEFGRRPPPLTSQNSLDSPLREQPPPLPTDDDDGFSPFPPARSNGGMPAARPAAAAAATTVPRQTVQATPLAKTFTASRPMAESTPAIGTSTPAVATSTPAVAASATTKRNAGPRAKPTKANTAALFEDDDDPLS